MWLLIDMTNLVVRHKYPDHRVINALAHIELSHVGTSVIKLERDTTFPQLTDLDLRLLYKNSTGQSFPGYMRKQLEDWMRGIALAMPSSDVNPLEVFAQAAEVDAKDRNFYRYMKGSKVPELLSELWLPTALTATPEAGAAALLAPAPAPDSEPAAPTPQAKPIAAPVGGVRGTVFDAADALWQAAGKPTDLKAVLSIRKQVMDNLEASHGIKRTTCSTTLGDWQKVRLNG